MSISMSGSGIASMSPRRKITWLCLLVLAAVIKTLSYFPAAVEKYYSQGFYPVISRLLRFLVGWVPFSVGDIIYLALIAVLLYRLVALVRRIVKREMLKGWFLRFVQRTGFFLLWVYVLFNGLWGLNYNRQGIAQQLQLSVRPYSNAELLGLLDQVVVRLNDLDSVARIRREDLSQFRKLRGGATEAYDSLALTLSQFAYRGSSVKPSLFSYPGVYIGFAGYYNPFTGEAQVNTWNPLFTQPYTTCHEMGHQLGYAKENEANFIGFLAARSSPDPAYRYSVFFDLFLYAWNELRFRDSALAKSYRNKLGKGLREDLLELKRFNQRYANDLEPMIWNAYGRYLRANRQPQGIMTYSDVTAWLIAYIKKSSPEAVFGSRPEPTPGTKPGPTSGTKPVPGR